MAEDDPAGHADGRSNRSQVYRRYDEQRKFAALLECIEFAGINLLDVESKRVFAERLARGELVSTLLAAHKDAGIDLRDKQSVERYTENLRADRVRFDRDKKRSEARPKLILGIIGAIATGILTVSLPDLLAWVKAHML